MAQKTPKERAVHWPSSVARTFCKLGLSSILALLIFILGATSIGAWGDSYFPIITKWINRDILTWIHESNAAANQTHRIIIKD